MKNIEDISEIDLSESVTVQNPADPEACRRMKASTLARICIGRAGARYRTQALLRFRADHAVAMDAVWSNVDESIVESLGFYTVQTLVKNKDEYLTRPDLGRCFSEGTIQSIRRNCIHDPDVQIIAADGLSSPAINNNIRDIFPIMMDGLTARGYRIGTPIFVKFGRVATMDKISEALGAKVTILLVGERPGLAVGDSMSSYMAYESSPSKPESQRTVISNIHRKGTPPVEAGAHIVSIVDIMMEKKSSGVDLKL
ncbi:MAG TPA: ethanolamine ammonia-lyase subunit EutC [Caproiciproducens sp.]|nr:ethanolamine ammonia-lyase subunit EutC [Caproiciproducens sp.]